MRHPGDFDAKRVGHGSVPDHLFLWLPVRRPADAAQRVAGQPRPSSIRQTHTPDRRSSRRVTTQKLEPPSSQLLRQRPLAPPRSDWMVPLLLILGALACAVFSNGFFELDEIIHFKYSLRVWSHTTALLAIWGRLGSPGDYALAAPLGLPATRLMAVGLTILVAVGTLRVMN